MKELESRPQFGGVNLDGDITEQSRKSFCATLHTVSDMQQGGEVPVFITSHGGSLDEMMLMVDSMQRVKDMYGVSLSTVAKGYALSGGAILLAIGDKRYAFEGTTILLHDIQVAGPDFPEDFQKRRARELRTRKQQRIYEKKMSDRMGRPISEIRGLYNRYLNEKEALKEGIIDEIIVYPKYQPTGWGIEVEWPDGTREILPTGDEQMAELIMGQGAPQNGKGEFAIRGKKVRI